RATMLSRPSAFVLKGVLTLILVGTALATSPRMAPHQNQQATATIPSVRSVSSEDRSALRNLPESQSAGGRASRVALVREPWRSHVATRCSRLLRRIRYVEPLGLQGRRS